MIPTPLQDTYRLKINLRAPKFAYFFREDDANALTEILRFSCTQWGGAYNVLIPVPRDGSLSGFSEYLLRLTDPDGFVGNFKGWNRNPPGIYSSTLTNLKRLFSHRNIQLMPMRSFLKYDPSPHPLNAVPDTISKATTLSQVQLDKNWGKPWLELALYGQIYAGQEQGYEAVLPLEDQEVEVSSRSFWESQYQNDPFASILNFTTYGIQPHTVEGPIESNYFDLVFVDSLSDLCYFWNLRAIRESTQFDKTMGRRTFCVPVELLDEATSIESLCRFIQRNLVIPNCHSTINIYVTALSEEKAEQLCSSLNRNPILKRHSTDVQANHTRWSGPTPPEDVNLDVSFLSYAPSGPLLPQRYLEGIEPQIAHRVELSFGRNEILSNPPVSFRNRAHQAVVVDFICDVWQRYPKSDAVSSAIVSQGWFSKYGFSSLWNFPQNPTYLPVQLPDEWETLGLYFRQRGYEIKSSKDGQYADALVTLIGGMHNMQLLASKEAYLLLDLLALRSTKKIAQRITQQFALRQEQLVDIQRVLEDVEVISELRGITKSFRQLQQRLELQPHKGKLLPLIDELTRTSVLLRGFYLDCPRCGAPDWYSLEAAKERIACSGCGHRFPLPVEQPKGTEIQWQYRLNTLVNRAMDQDVLPNLLALYHLTSGESCTCLTTGLSLQKEGKEKEFDFLFCLNQQIYAGECKAGTGLEEKDMVTARLASELGVVKFYFATTSVFSEEAQELVRRLCTELKESDAEMEVFILSEAELLNTQPLRTDQGKRGGARHPSRNVPVNMEAEPPAAL